MPKLDDVSWHLEAAGIPDATAESRAGLHIGLFLSWAIESGQWKGLQGQDEDEVGLVRTRNKTGTEFLLEQCDGKLYSEMLTPEVARFAERFYRKGYLRLYAAVLRSKSVEQYMAKDTWELHDLLSPELNSSLAAESRKSWWRFW